MNGSFTINGEDTIKILTKYVEASYPYGPCHVTPRITLGYSDYRDSSPDRVNFTFKCQKDLGLGIGPTTIEVSMSEDEAKGLIKNVLASAGIENQGISFNISSSSGYMDKGGPILAGTNVILKSVREILPPSPMKVIGGI